MKDNKATAAENTAANEIKISDEVIQSIAIHTIKDTENISLAASLTDGIVEKFVRKNNPKSVRVEITENNITLDVHISVDYGVKIPSVCAALQENIRKNIENITDMNVSAVNIFVDGISIEKTKPAASKEADSEPAGE